VDYLPIFLDIRDRPCLVVGGGEVAARKADLLLRAGGRVTVLAPHLCPTLQRRHLAREIQYRQSSFEEEALQGIFVVVAATSDETANARIAQAARARGIPVNVVDHPESCTFVFPSIIDRSPVLIAVSTGGASPILSRMLRTQLEAFIPAAYGRLADLLKGIRAKVRAAIPGAAARRRFFENILDGPVSELVFSGREAQAEDVLDQALRGADEGALSRGEVYLIGAGPGDPDLLTFRALRLMQRADVVLYDRLVSPQILDLVRREAVRIYVGKKRDYHTVRQEEINETLVTLVREGKRVVRLKGGDPFIFGRGGEEIATLAQEGIAFQVVPGITAANGCAAYAGIPLTHRDFAQSVLFVTGHLKDGRVNLDWTRLVQPQQTLVIYMGLTGLDLICRELIAHGAGAHLPAALIEQGTLPEQRVLTGTLSTLPDIVARSDVHAPTLLIVGEVVRLRDRLKWFDH
jgi:uroporphyrin-III C-methyltransferase/precorrin-2 dehydrogenase/sirohydrochlorin ferrochelatase